MSSQRGSLVFFKSSFSAKISGFLGCCFFSWDSSSYLPKLGNSQSIVSFSLHHGTHIGFDLDQVTGGPSTAVGWRGVWNPKIDREGRNVKPKVTRSSNTKWLGWATKIAGCKKVAKIMKDEWSDQTWWNPMEILIIKTLTIELHEPSRQLRSAAEVVLDAFIRCLMFGGGFPRKVAETHWGGFDSWLECPKIANDLMPTYRWYTGRYICWWYFFEVDVWILFVLLNVVYKWTSFFLSPKLLTFYIHIFCRENETAPTSHCLSLFRGSRTVPC